MNNIRNCIYIPSIDAKDLYLANNFKDKEKNKTGYKLTTKTGDINYNRFINSLDFSLDSEKIRETAANIYVPKEIFSFWHNGREYSDKIINVTFKYSSKDFNKVKKNTFVMDGYSLSELEFKDNIAVDSGMIVGIILSAPTLKKTMLDLPEGFIYIENPDGDFIYSVKTVGVIYSKKELRNYLYHNGFNCNGKHYIRLKRTSGSARVGKCLFIEEHLYPQIHKWEMCGLTVKEGDCIDLAALESYISLPTSSAIDTIKIDPKSILIIPDCESKFKEDSIIVEMDKNKRMVAREGEIEISNSIFDGQSLIDKSIMGEYENYGMVLLRNRFFKSCCFNTNIQKWFEDSHITSISQLNKDAVTLAEDIKEIKLITTPNSIKYIKFAPLLQWLNNIDSIFSVVKHEKKTHFFNGKMVQAHYQLLNTLQLTPEEIRCLLEPSLKYVNLLNTDTDVLKYHVKCSILDSNIESPVSNVFKDKNDIIYTMMNISDIFYRTKYFYDFKKETCKSYLKNLKKGHILINGNYSVLFGNPYEMLLHTIGEFDINLNGSSLPSGHIHTKRYPYGKKLLGCRSPHISTSNILITTNMRHDLIDTYFNLTEEIVCLNAINENIMERLSGCDYDSDQMILTDNEILINAAIKNYEVFKVPANRVEARKSKRFYTSTDKSDLDYCTSENKIGEIVNLSQELNTLMWDIINQSHKSLKDSYAAIKEIYHDICILNVLSCIEIDKAKKEFDISSSREIKEIKEKWARRTFDKKVIKPAFLGFIAQTKGYRNPLKKKYNYHKTSMDYLLKEINHYRSGKTEADNFAKLSECFQFSGFHAHSVNWKQTNKIVKLCETATSAINAVWSKDYYTTEEKYILTQRYKDDLVFGIQKMKINQHTLFILITYVDMEKYSRISKLLFFVLFNYKNEIIIDMMTNMAHPASYIQEYDNGEIDLYGIKFKRYGGNNIE
ncbi:MAG: hypothetical protein K1W19_08060 [Lachnospiraceae bacterium]